MIARIFSNGKGIKVDPLKHPDKLCHGQQCYIRLAKCINRDTVPCHANSVILGKGMGHKVNDIYTVPGCSVCHYEIDQGKALLKSERKSAWLRAYERWGPYRQRTYGVPYHQVEML